MHCQRQALGEKGDLKLLHLAIIEQADHEDSARNVFLRALDAQISATGEKFVALPTPMSAYGN